MVQVSILSPRRLLLGNRNLQVMDFQELEDVIIQPSQRFHKPSLIVEMFNIQDSMPTSKLDAKCIIPVELVGVDTPSFVQMELSSLKNTSFVTGGSTLSVPILRTISY